MVTGWTLLIVFSVAFGNAWVACIGVRFRQREGMRLWANDAGYYLPVHFGFPSFYRGLYINLSFASTSFALAASFLPGESSFCGREAVIGIALMTFLCSFIVACLIPSDFEQVLVLLQGVFWRVVLVGILILLAYVGSGIVIGNYVSSLPSTAKS